MQQLATRLVSTRRGTLIVALLIALLAGASILLYINSYRDTLKSQGALVTVLVAKKNIPRGTAGNVIAAKDLYTVTTIRESQLLEGAMSDPASLRNQAATREIFEGAQLTATDFKAAGDSIATTLTDRQRVISVSLKSAQGLIDVLEPGNRVDVYVSMAVIQFANGVPDRGGQSSAVTRLIVSDVPVVLVGEKARRGSTGTTNVALRVDDVTAAKIQYANQYGAVSLALRPTAGAKASKRRDLINASVLLLDVPPVEVYKALGGRE